MCDMNDILDSYLHESHGPTVLATLFSVYGSHVYHPGAMALLQRDGSMCGSVSAGCLEDDLIAHAEPLFADGGAKMVRYCGEELADSVLGLGLGCGGDVSVLLELLPDVREESHVFALHEALRRDIVCACATYWNPEDSSIQHAPQRIIVTDATCVFDSTRNQPIRERLLQMTQAPTNANDGETLIVIHKPALTLTVFGAGEVASALSALADIMGWRVCRMESKEALAVAERGIRTDSFVVILTHNDDLERQLLGALLPQNLPYIGALGSRSRLARVIGAVRQANPEITERQWAALHAPIGLDIGGDSPGEIALSIVSEIVASLHGRTGCSLREKLRTLHPRNDTISEFTV